MTKIKDYTQDSAVAKDDKLIGTDSADDSTKAFSVESLSNYVHAAPVGIQALSGASVNVTAGSARVVVLTEESGTVNVNLHTAIDNQGVVFSIVALNGNDFTIDPYDTETIDGASTKSITTDRVTIVAYNGGWLTID